MLIDDVLGAIGLKIRANPAERPSWLHSDTAWPTFDTMAEDWSLRKLQRQAMQCSWVYSDVNLLARKVGQGKLRVMQMAGDEKERVQDHEFERLMRRPNELMSGRFLLQYTMMWLNLDGNAYWWLAPNIQNRLVEIWPLPARDVTPKQAKSDSGAVLAGYEYTPTRDKLLPVERICHFRLANPFNPLKGLTPISALRHEIAGDLSMKQWNVNFFNKKNALPTTIISLPQSTGEGDFDRIKKKLAAEFGAMNRKAMVTRAGDVDVKTVGLSQRDMDFLAGIELNRETIDRVYGIPAAYWAKDANRNTSSTAELIVMRDVVQPALDYIAEEIDAQVIDRYYDKELWVEADNMVPEDRTLNLAEFKEHKTVMKVGEARGRIGLPPLEDGRDDMLVPELTATMAGGGMFKAALPETTEGAFRGDLLTWRKVALKEVARGHDPGSREFISDEIPAHVKAAISGALMGMTDTEAVSGVFQPWIDGRGYEWIGYP
jgi:HK97 family phage portal protein